MVGHVQEFIALPAHGRPDLHRVNSRMLHGRPGIVVTYFVFDVLAVAGLATTVQPYAERRAPLEQLELETERVRLVATFEDGEALLAAVCERGLEGVVAKRASAGATRYVARTCGSGAGACCKDFRLIP